MLGRVKMEGGGGSPFLGEGERERKRRGKERCWEEGEKPLGVFEKNVFQKKCTG